MAGWPVNCFSGKSFSSAIASSMDNANFFVGWGTLSLINAGLAQAKGRSGLVWWLISLFLGPLATFLIVILARVPLGYGDK
jgi:hypothetical protein